MPAGGRNGGGQRAPWAGAAPQKSLQERFDALEQVVRELRGGGGSGGGGEQRRGVGKGGQTLGGGGGGGLGKGAASSAYGGNRGRPGDWTCGSCGAFPCFARAARCYLCHAPRTAGPGVPPQQRGGKGGGPLARSPAVPSYLGPIGANGSRPLLGRRGADEQAAGGQGRGQAPTADVSPTFRVPGASAAARVEQQRREQGTLHQDSAQQPQQRTTDTTTTAGTATATATPHSALPVASPVPQIQTANRWAALDEAGDDDGEEDDATIMECDDDGDGGGGDAAVGAGGGAPQAGEADPTPAELRHEWEKLCATYRRLEREGDVPPSVMAAVRTQREAAERRWRAAKPVQPLHKRLRWAEAELKEAETREMARQRELEDHLSAAARRTAEIERRLAVDRARTERKRSVLQGLQGREAVARCPASEAAARIALQGIADDIAPAITAAMASLGDAPTATHQGLRHAAQALAGVQEVLREAAAAAAESRQPTGLLGGALGIAREDIGDGPAGGRGERDHGGGSEGGAGNAGPPSEECGRQGWTRVGPGGQWKKARTSAAMVEEARLILQARGGERSLGSDGLPPTATEGRADGGAAGGSGRDDGHDDDATRTNDLGEAARRTELAARRQIQEAADRQRQHSDPRQLLEEETARQQRAQQQQIEMQKHQAALEAAAAARAAEERRQREELVARMSPEDLAAAAEAHAQQLAVGAHAFGSQPASHVAGLVHQARVHGAVQEVERSGGDADPEFLMSLSPEEFARWDQDRQGGDNGSCPW